MKTFSLFIAILCLAGCDSDPTSMQGYGVIMPLAVGNRWIYQNEYLQPDGRIDSMSAGPWGVLGPYKDTVLLLGKALIGNDICYYVKSFCSGCEEAYTNRNDGLWTYFRGDMPPSGNFDLLIPYPITIGESKILWEYETEVEDSINHITYLDTVRVVITLDAVNASVRVPAGDFTCYKYREDLIYASTGEVIYYDIYYYEVGKGLIASEGYSHDAKGALYLASRSSLLSLTLH